MYVCKFNSVVRGQYIFRSVRTPLTDETRKFIMPKDNKHGQYAVIINCSHIRKDDTHIKRDIEKSLKSSCMDGTILTII